MSKDKADGQESEQSMEDILASIRKIISDEDEPEDGSSSSSYADDEDVSDAESDNDVDDADDDDDVLELSDPLPDDEPEPATANSASAVADEPDQNDDEADAGDLLVVEDMEEAEEAVSKASSVAAEAEADDNDDDDDFGLVLEDAPEEAEEEVEDVMDEPELAVVPQASADALQSSLLSPEAAALSAGALASLRSGDSITGAMGVGANGNTVEALVADLLKPMLKQWLDIHLPSMVENLVREEIQRIQRQDKD